MTDIFIYNLCYRYKENKDTQFNQQNLMCGSIFYTNEYKNYLINNSFLLDCTKINISEYNHIFGQLTGLYWVWKNTIEDFIGTSTYRIFWNKEQIEMCKNKIYVPYLNNHISLYSQYTKSYAIKQAKYINGMNLLYFDTKKNCKYFTTTMLNNAYSQNILYPFLIFIAQRNIFDKICEILFDTIFNLYYKYEDYCTEFMRIINSTRVFDILGERIVTIILLNSKYFFGDKVIVVPTNTYQYDHSNYTNFKIEAINA